MNYIEDTEFEFAANPDIRCPCILLLDTSAPMNGIPIDALNQGLPVFQADLQQDGLARRRVEIAIVTFGSGGVQIIQPFVIAGQFQAPFLTAGGNTPMGAAINLALDMLCERKNLYQQNGIPYYRPWVFMVTNGTPTDQWQTAAHRIHMEVSSKALAFFAVGVGNADMERLAQIVPRKPRKLQGLKFSELFLWLSHNLKRAISPKTSYLSVRGEILLTATDDWAVAP